MDTEALVLDVFAGLGVEAYLPEGPTDASGGVVVEPHGAQVVLQVERRTLVSTEVAERLLAEAVAGDGTLLVVADRVTDQARRALVSGRAGYLDLRGHLALRTDRLVVDTDIEPIKHRESRSSALAGRVGLEVASALLMRPDRSPSGRQLARRIGRSASTVSEVLVALREDGLIDDANSVVGNDLFWLLAERWPVRRTYLAERPPLSDASLASALRLGLADVADEPGWALSDSAAAAAFGAPLAFRPDQSIDFYVPEQQVVRRAVTLLGEARAAAQAVATVRVAPVPVIVKERIELPDSPMGWPLAHPLFVALDLAGDVGRGREILDSWDPGRGWARVW